MTPRSYSALIEVVGLRDLAEEEPDLFINVSSEYRNVMTGIFNGRPHFMKREWIDSCFIQCQDPGELLAVLIEARDRLLGLPRPVLIRGVAVAGACFNEFVEFTQGAAKLEGRVSRLKACAFDIDEHLILKLRKTDRSMLFINFCLTHRRQGGHIPIHDLVLLPQNELKREIELWTIVHQVIDGAERAPKASRFFVPIIVNIVKNYHRTKVIKLLESLESDVEVYNFLKRKIPESEFIFFAALDRFLTPAKSSTTRRPPSSVPEPVKKWAEASRGWIFQRANADHKHGPVPFQICSPEARGVWRRMIREKKTQDRNGQPDPREGNEVDAES